MIRRSTRLFLAGAVALGGMTLISTEASAQATRTWISGVGADDNPCSRTAPCRTWQGAMTNTAQGGEIDCLDPGGFGAVTITKSITLYCPYSDGGVLVAGQNGIIINDSASPSPGTANVVIDGLNIEGLGYSTTSPGIRGIWFVSGAQLTVRNAVIRGFKDPTNGAGIGFTPSGAAKLVVENTSLIGNGNTGTGGGIVVQPTGTGSANVTITGTRSINNTNNGLGINTTGNTGSGISVAITDSVFNGNSGSGIGVTNPAGTTSVKVNVLDSSTSGNAIGIVSNGASSVIRVGRTQITNNTSFGVFAVGAGVGLGILSYAPASNALNGNATDGSFSGTVAYQ